MVCLEGTRVAPRASRTAVVTKLAEQEQNATDYTGDPGVALMLAYQDGDESAFDELVETYSSLVWSLLTRFIGQGGTREDLVQEAFLRVIKARDRYLPTARFSTYIYRIVYHLAINETQRRRTHASLDQPKGEDNDGSMGEDILGDELGPSEELEREDTINAVRAAISELPEGQRMALILAKYHELSYAEIAETLESTEKAIKSLVHRARESLREKLAPFLREERGGAA
jgi:RNA polymerase sigma-70 factor (ECF subfamily)